MGRFRRPPDHQDFRDSGPIQSDGCFAFPRTPVVIRHSGERFVADPTVATIYNRGQEYTREALTPDGDRCDWYAVSEETLREALRAHDMRAADAPRPLRWTHAPVSAGMYLAQRRLFNGIVLGSLDAMDVEETVLGLVDGLLAAACGHEQRAPTSRAHRDVVAAAQWSLARRLRSDVALHDVAADAGVSVFHLCRTFRSVTGGTLFAYRTQLRVRVALERMSDVGDLSAVALDLGFSSHSHFTAAFRRAFGATPSLVRSALGARRRMPLDTMNTRPER